MIKLCSFTWPKIAKSNYSNAIFVNNQEEPVIAEAKKLSAASRKKLTGIQQIHFAVALLLSLMKKYYQVELEEPDCKKSRENLGIMRIFLLIQQRKKQRKLSRISKKECNKIFILQRFFH
jgi:hypothetical protein